MYRQWTRKRQSEIRPWALGECRRELNDGEGFPAKKSRICQWGNGTKMEREKRESGGGDRVPVERKLMNIKSGKMS